MTDLEFRRWMQRVAADSPAAEIPDSGAIWWRAELRARIAAGERVTRPLRVAERLACALCLAGAAVIGARMNAIGVAPFLAVMLVAAAGAAAFLLRGTAE